MTLELLASGLTALIGVLMLVIGGRFLLVPEAAATAYGVPASPRGDAGAYLMIKGVRDGVSGLVVLALLAAGQHQALGWFILVAALIPVGDALIVLQHKGPAAVAYGIHAVTAVLLVAIGVLLLVT
jgi:hypothetical protein